MNTLEQIEEQIKELEKKLETVQGTETEVYTRIVGYYRAVKNWNKGKKEEYRHRICFSSLEREENQSEETEISATSYLYFYRKTCPNCPSVKNYIETLDIKGQYIDADTDEGLKTAAENNVFSVPAVIFFDKEKKESFRAFSTAELKENLLCAV